MNCEMSYTDDISMKEIAAKNMTDKALRIELIWRQRAQVELKLKEKICIMHIDRDSERSTRQSAYQERQESINIYDCLKLDSQAKKLELGNEWYCKVCKDHVLATKQL
jgi:ubiquitin C-terminal hydrolase